MNVTSYLQGRKLTIALCGELDHHQAKKVIHEISDKIATFLPKECSLDLGELTFMDSSGIAVVINAKRCMEELDGDISIKAVQSQPQKVLLAAGIDKIIPIQ